MLRGRLSLTPADVVIPINDVEGLSKYSAEEKADRCKLASFYRLVGLWGWDQLIYNHITLRLSDNKSYLINPLGLTFSEITASSLVKVNINGDVIDPGSTDLDVNLAGYVLHSAIHSAREDARCVAHVHTPPGAGVSCMKCGFMMISQEAMSVGEVAYHDYTGLVVNDEEKESIQKDLGPTASLLVLRSHGLVALGDTIEACFRILYDAVRACEIQVAALAGGIENIVLPNISPDEVWKAMKLQGGDGVSRLSWRSGLLEWESQMRILDRLGYKTGQEYETKSAINNSLFK
ncbi:alpha-adducin-like isoform X2 [Oscarella lobularis]|uniref:alpha-adducin-like isoform X2 n=1 Tax=Oscarella lobularis TaxID=121494 RepID=UPI003313A976